MGASSNMTTFIPQCKCDHFKKAQKDNGQKRCKTLYSGGRPLQLLWELFSLQLTFPSGFCLEKLAEGKTPRKGKRAAGAMA